MVMIQAILHNPVFLEGKEFISIYGFNDGTVQAHYNAIGTLHYKTVYLDVENNVESMRSWLLMHHPNAKLNKINYVEQ
jgi:hypothetical protein